MNAQTRDILKQRIDETLRSHFGVRPDNATDAQFFGACAYLLREMMSRRLAEMNPPSDKRKVHYLSMEFLIGRSLSKNAFNLGVLDELYAALESMGRRSADIFELEPDAALGNGGLGRLAACYMDSMSTLDIPATGYSICYELGMFKQKIENGGQVEEADPWMDEGKHWIVSDRERMVEVHFGGRVEQHWDNYGNCKAEHTDYSTVYALPRDMLISGFGTSHVNRLCLWEARSPNSLDMYLFSSGEFAKSLEQRTETEVITKVLYPPDNHFEGKVLRVKQQYFFVSATAQTILRQHRQAHGDVRSFAAYNVIQINDTHPVLIIPEMMRILIDEDGLGWDEAWKVVSACVAYTNHTVMAEALECWPQGLIQALLPRVWEILVEINSRRRMELSAIFKGDIARINRNLVICDGKVSMAELALAACFKVNGVSKLHGEILRNDLFRDEEDMCPGKIISITNGIDHRRWLPQINPALNTLVCELIGDSYFTKPERLIELKKFLDDKTVLRRLEEIKRQNKASMTAWLQREQGVTLMTDGIFDVQIKRLHEYKRQLMCAMLITHLQNQLRETPDMDFMPRTFVFGAKAASGYKVAKRIIRLLVALSESVDKDPACKGKLQVVFMENYRVSAAEKLMPAAQVSEQISTAGKEASGTGNMKLMMNGAITIGTLDGANVEMYERLGDEGLFLFGLRADEVATLRQTGYNPENVYRNSSELQNVFRRMSQGYSGSESFSDLVSRLVYQGDEFMLIADFDSYLKCHERLYDTIRDEDTRSRISLLNIAESGIFAADRAIREYEEEIWA
ncbi:MAG: glycogen/starch/alpha-glucan phosphorylase [Firmicutes bacterium]|nr:glycogen/starch/alpha-glucan phosphorylase [Bacillota bacterium]